MKNKNKMLLSLLTVLTLIPTIPSYADTSSMDSTTVNPIIVSHFLPAANDNTQVAAVSGAVDGGFGWDSGSYWHTGTAPTKESVTAANRVIRKVASSENTYYMFNPKANAAALYRTMAEENYIDPTIDADYYISFISRDALGSMSSVTNNPSTSTQSINHKFFVGSTGLYASFSKFATDDTTNWLTTALTVNNETTQSSKSILCGTVYKNLIWIDANESGEDIVRYQLVGINEGFDLNSWDLEMSADLGDNKLTYVGFQSNGQGTAQVGDIVIEKYDSLTTALDAYAKLSAGNSITKQECETALESIAKYTDGTIKNIVFPELTQYIVDNNYSDLLVSKKVSATFEENAVLHTQDYDKLEIAFNYAFGSGNYIAELLRDGKSVPADISFKGNKLIVENADLMPDGEYAVKITNAKNLFEVVVTDFEFKFRTSIVPVINVKDGDMLNSGDVISWTDAEGVITTVTVGDAEIANGEGIDRENGEYTLKISSVKGEEASERSIKITVNKPTVPTAKNVKIELEEDASVETGTMLVGSYDYDDINDDSEDENSTICKWYSCNKDGTGEAEIGTGKKYTLAETDENKYIVFKVTPASTSDDETKFGETVSSAVMTGAFAPTASNISFVSKPKLGEKLEVKFDYADLNGDEMDDAIYEWHLVDGTTDTQIIPEQSTEEADNSKLMITEEYIGKQIYVKVTPKSKKAPFNGGVETSDKVYAPEIPYAENIKINGTAKVGNTLYVTYDYRDINGDQEGESKIEWINALTDEVLSTNESLSLTNQHKGISIFARVTPMSSEAPFEGMPITGSSVEISSGSSSGGNGGGGGFSYSGSSSGSVKPTVEKDEVETPVAPIEKVFSDIVGHWSEEYVIRCRKLGIVNGKTDTTFEPEGNVTRAEILAMLLRAKGINTAEYKGAFADVDQKDWYAGYVQYALDNGIISQAELFRPNDNVKRSEAAKMIAVANNILAEKGTELSYNDKNSLPEWSVEFICALFEADIMSGDDNGSFNPEKSLKRGEMAKIICKTIDYTEIKNLADKTDVSDSNEEAAQ